MSKRTHNIIFTFLFILAVVIMVSCGGGNSNLPKAPNPDYTLTGKAFIGNVSNATVSLYSYDEVNPTLITSTTTDNTGKYTLTTNVLSDTLLLCVSGGRVTDAFSSITSSLTDELCAVTVNSGKDAVIAITYYSHIAYGLNQFLYNDPTFTGSSPDVIRAANGMISAWVGFNVIETLPEDVTLKTGNSILNEAARAGFATAAVSVLAKTMKSTSPAIAVKAYNDIKYDGILNGLDENGKTLLTTTVYRHDIALNILIFANNQTSNGTNITSKDLVGLATQYNTHESSIFGTDAVAPFSMDKPNIQNVSILDNDVLAGDKLLRADIVDLVGVSNVSMVISHPTFVKSVGTLKNSGTIIAPSSKITTTNFTEGLNYTITITATNILNSVKVLTIKNLAISNTGTSFKRILPQFRYLNKIQTLSVDMYDPVGISGVVLKDNGITRQPTSVAANVYSFRFDTRLLSDGDNVFTFEAANLAGAVTTKMVTYSIDNTPPILSFDPIAPYWGISTYQLIGNVTDNIKINTGKLIIGTYTLTTKLLNGKLTLDATVNARTTQGVHNILLSAQDMAGNSSTLAATVIVDFTSPRINLPKQTVRPTINSKQSSCILNYTASDTGGSGLGSGKIDRTVIVPANNGKHTVEFINLLFVATNEYAINYFVNDKAGNSSTINTARFFVDCPRNAQNCSCGIR